MAGITLETAKRHLDAWLEAELAVTNAQSYTIGSRTMTKANLTEIRKSIEYWQGHLRECPRRRHGRAAPRVPSRVFEPS